MATAPSWITFDKISGTGNATIQIQADENAAASLRQGSFSVRTVDGKIERVVEVTQYPVKTNITINVSASHTTPENPGTGVWESNYTLSASCNAAPSSDVTVTVRINSDEGRVTGTVTVRSGETTGSGTVHAENTSGMFDNSITIVACNPESDLYHNYNAVAR